MINSSIHAFVMSLWQAACSPEVRMLGVHRIVESHAAERGSEVALIGPDGALTYVEMNKRANALARYLIGQGLRRGSRAVVKMPQCLELGIALLAVLKAGAAYTWLDLREDDLWPEGISLVREGNADGVHHADVLVDTRAAIEASSGHAPNLPILTRGHDIACVMPRHNVLPGLLVPHATIVALRLHPLPTPVRWLSDPGALDLWLPLMAGVPVTLTATDQVAAA